MTLGPENTLGLGGDRELPCAGCLAQWGMAAACVGHQCRVTRAGLPGAQAEVRCVCGRWHLMEDSAAATLSCVLRCSESPEGGWVRAGETAGLRTWTRPVPFALELVAGGRLKLRNGCFFLTQTFAGEDLGELAGPEQQTRPRGPGLCLQLSPPRLGRTRSRASGRGHDLC